MASASTSPKQDLSEINAEALQALLNSISPEDARRPGQKLSSDQLKKISDKLGELLGDSELGEIVGTQKRNEKGELLNEEGLPIIDIAEPVKEGTTQSSAPAPVRSPPLFDDPDLLPLWALSPAEKARRKAEREHILDLLEEEERIEQEREEATERERWYAELEKRKEAAKGELESLRKARELQKKMGKALLRNVIEAHERAEKDAQQEAKEWMVQKEQEKGKLKKSVSFADVPGSEADGETSEDGSRQCGDVSLARLRKGKTPLLTRAQMDKQPMKMDVIERHPGGTRTEAPSQSAEPDSDDESVPGSPVPADSDEGDAIYSDADSDEHSHHDPPLSDSDATDVERMSDGGEPVSWQDEDFDYAQHQREVALAYYEKRATVGMEAYSAMRAHSHDEDAHEWDQPEVPLDATLASPPPRPSTSRFKAERATAGSSNTLASHSLGSSVLPSSQASGLKKAVRMGKLENGQLIGDDSDDDVTQEAKEIVELLSQGEVTNVGPQLGLASSSNTVPLSGPSTAAFADAPSPHPGLSQGTPATAKPRSKVSKFKMSLAQAERQDPAAPTSPSLETPRMTSVRSSPKLSSPSPATPIAVPTSTSQPTERRHNEPQVIIPQSVRRKAAQGQMPSMIVESPSFRPPASTRMPSMIVEPPSFSPPSRAAAGGPSGPPIPSTGVESRTFISPGSGSTYAQSPPFQSLVFDSPSFQNPAAAQQPQPSVPRSMSVPTSPATVGARRPGVVMAAKVKESAPPPGRGDATGSSKEKRVSKFKAERM